VPWLRVSWVVVSCRGILWIELPSHAVAESGLGCCLVAWVRVDWVAVLWRGIEWIDLPSHAVA